MRRTILISTATAIIATATITTATPAHATVPQDTPQHGISDKHVLHTPATVKKTIPFRKTIASTKIVGKQHKAVGTISVVKTSMGTYETVITAPKKAPNGKRLSMLQIRYQCMTRGSIWAKYGKTTSKQYDKGGVRDRLVLTLPKNSRECWINGVMVHGANYDNPRGDYAKAKLHAWTD